jgi:hypothetical protein
MKQRRQTSLAAGDRSLAKPFDILAGATQVAIKGRTEAATPTPLIEAARFREGRSDASRDRAVSDCGVSGRRAVKQHLHQEQSFRPLTRPGYFLLLAQKKANQRKGLPCKGTSPRDRSRRRDAPDRPSMACLRTARIPAGRPPGPQLTGKASDQNHGSGSGNDWW